MLLANDDALPLDASDGSIAVIGADADHYIDGGGSGAIQYPAQLTTILDGITARAETEVTYAQGTDPVSLAARCPGPSQCRPRSCLPRAARTSRA
ncbi:glycoside hydrolase family 3 C-terminal domain-containing protein [Oerskovia sp. M15]